MIKAELQPMYLVLWEKKELPERQKNSVTGEWDKTGKMIEYTTYTFRDEFGETLKFMMLDDGYRKWEGSEVQLTIGITYDDYNNVNKLKLESIEQLGS